MNNQSVKVHNVYVLNMDEVEMITAEVPKPKPVQYLSKKLYDAFRSKTRVSVGTAFERWRALKEEKGLKTDAQLARFLLDR